MQHDKSEFIVSEIINQILDNYNDFEKLINVELTSIENTDDYITYLVFKQILVVEDSNFNSLNGDDVKKLTDLCFKTKNNNKVEPKILIEYIQNNFVEIFNLPIDYIENITIDIIAKYPTGFHDKIQNYLFQNYTYFIIHQFDQFEKWFKKNPKYIKEIINVEFLEKNYWTYLSEVLDILKHLKCRRSSDINKITDGIIKEIFDRLLIISKESNSKNSETRDVLILEKVFTIFQEFLIETKSPFANTFKSSVDRINNFVNNHIEENGKSFTYEIPYQSNLEKFKLPDSDIVELTHKVEEQSQRKILISRFSLLKPDHKELFDLFSSNEKTDDYFTRSYQRQINITLQILSVPINEIINDLESLKKFQKMVFFRIKYICKVLNSKEDLKEVGVLLLNSISCLNTYRGEHLLLLRTQCYNTNILIFVMIEKLLRSLYLDLVKDKKYVPNSITLGALLGDSNEELKKSLGESYIRNLSFFLSRTGDGREIGHDYRNRFVHYNDIVDDMLSIRFTSKILYLLLDLVNTLFIYCAENCKQN